MAEQKEHASFAAIERSKNLDAERAVIGGCFQSPEILDWLELEAEAFVDPRCRAVWGAMLTLRRSGKAVDDVTVADLLRRAERFPAVGGEPYLLELQMRVPTTDMVVAYADILREHLINRRLLLIGAGVAGYLDGGLSGEELLARVQRDVAEAEPHRTEEGQDLSAAVADEVRAIDEYFESDVRHVGIPTGIRQLDEKTGGLPIGVPSVLGARPGEGKSTLAMNIAVHAAAQGFGVHLFTYEDRAASWAQRDLAWQSGVDVSQIRARDLTDIERQMLRRAARDLDQRKGVVIEHAHGQSAQWLLRRVRGRRRSLGTKLVIVDYLQLMPGDRAVKRHEQVEANVNELAELAGRDNLAVLLVSQLNRQLESRSSEERTPQLSDFRDSGSIEQVGKLVLALSQPDPKSTALDIWVLKNHQGPKAHIQVTYDRPHCRIR